MPPASKSSWNATQVARALRLRKWFTRCVIALVSIVLFTIAIDHLYASSHSNDYRFDGQSFTVRSAESDDRITLETTLGETQSIHLLGVAPLDGRPMSAQMKSLPGKRITLKLDPLQTRDESGALLGYIYLSDRDMLNVAIVHDGNAFADRRHPYTLHALINEAETDARKKKRGLWEKLTDAQIPQWRKQWIAEIQAGKSKH